MLLKRNTPQNIVIGGIPGAMPPLIGWAAVTNNLSLEPFILFLIIFLWTPPHFWSLALKSNGDYKLAKIPMFPVVFGRAVTLRYILIYTVLLVVVSTLPFFLDMVSVYYFVFALFLGAIFIYCAVRMFSDDTYYLKTFKYSIFYLFLLFLLLARNKL